MREMISSKACDECRRKKRRCRTGPAGTEPGSDRCSNCIKADLTCSWAGPTQKRGPKSYVETLEERLRQTELLLQKLKIAEPDEVSSEAGRRKHISGSSTKDAKLHVKREPDLEDSPHPSDDEIHTPAPSAHIDWIQRVQSEPSDPRFYGKASGLMLIKTAAEYIRHHRENFPSTSEDRPDECKYQFERRPNFWKPLPWELAPHEDVVTFALESVFVEGKRLQFPDGDLLLVLVDLYFTRTNRYFPILHRPTFQKLMHDDLHLRNLGFANVLLLVCAMGSRFSDDPRVFVDGISPHSAGWMWYVQGQMEPGVVPVCRDLYDLQGCCLSALYVQGTSAPYTCWSMIGAGIRMAMDVGIHRRKMYGSKRSVDEELWIRAFWVLVNLDRITSCNLGRPCAIQDEDFDIDLPACCDDEYWEPSDPQVAFQQPADKPSVMAYYICLIQLYRILAFTLRTLYSINESKTLIGLVGEQWQQRIVEQINRAMNEWDKSLPDHLRWDPRQENLVFFHQSTMLHVLFYHLKIVVHRPFIASLHRPPPSLFVVTDPFAICVDAAKACSSILDIHIKRAGSHPAQTGLVAFVSGIILLLPVWRDARSAAEPPQREVADGVYACMRVLEALEARWHSAGRLRDILCELAYYGNLPSTPPASRPASPTLIQPREPPEQLSRHSVESSPGDFTLPRPSTYPSTDLSARPSIASFGDSQDLELDAHGHPSNAVSTSSTYAGAMHQSDGEERTHVAPAAADSTLPTSSIGHLGEAGFLDNLLSLWEPTGPQDRMTANMALADAWFPTSNEGGKSMSAAGWLAPNDWDLSSYLSGDQT